MGDDSLGRFCLEDMRANQVTVDVPFSDGPTGTCLVLGESDDTERLDGDLGVMDHRAVVCELTLATAP